MWIREGNLGTRNLFQCGSNEQGEDQKKGLQIKKFHKFWLWSQNSCNFSRILKWRPKKKGLRLKSFMKSDVSPQKLQKIRAVNTNLGVLGLDLNSNSPKPVNFFGAQSSLGGGGHNFCLQGTSSHLGGGAQPRNTPRVAGHAPNRYPWSSNRGPEVPWLSV